MGLPEGKVIDPSSSLMKKNLELVTYKHKI